MQQILIIQTASLGDVILSTSLAETLHRQYPDASIDYLIKEGYQSLFLGHPFIRNVFMWNKKEGKYRNLVNIAFRIRSIRYDAVVNVQRFASSGFVSALSGAGFRAGFEKNPLSFTYTHKVKHIINGSSHEIYRNHNLIMPLVNIPADKSRLYPSEADESFTMQYRQGRYITISPASLYFTKQLPADKWIELIDNIPSGTRVLLLGSGQDVDLCQSIVSTSKNSNVESLAGKLSFLQSSQVMKDAQMNYVNDSAPQHMASAVNAPVTAVFCSTVPSFGFGPLSDKSAIVETTVPLPCKPCGLHGYNRCPETHFKCAKTITVNQLLLPLTYE